MTVIVLTSVTGAPGTTTATVALALQWPRPCLVVEADVVGGSSILAGFLRGSVPHDRGLVDLAMAHRRGHLSEGLHRISIPLGASPTARLIPGLTGPEQVPTAQALWEPLVVALRGLEQAGIDVLVDAGRLGAVGAPTPLIREADLTLVVTRSALPALPPLPGRVRLVREELERSSRAAGLVGLLVIGPDRPYSNRELSTFAGAPVLAPLAWDPVAAGLFSAGHTESRAGTFVGRKRIINRSAFYTSVNAAIDRIVAAHRQHVSALAPILPSGGVA